MTRWIRRQDADDKWQAARPCFVLTLMAVTALLMGSCGREPPSGPTPPPAAPSPTSPAPGPFPRPSGPSPPPPGPQPATVPPAGTPQPAAHAAAVPTPGGIPYTIAELIECSGSTDYRVAGSVHATLTRTVASPQEHRYTFSVNGLAAMVDGQTEPVALPAGAVQLPTLSRDPRTHRLWAAGPPLQGLAQVANELLARSASVKSGPDGRVRLPLFPSNTGGFPTQVQARFETKEILLAQGPVRLVSHESEKFHVPGIPGANGRAFTAQFRGTMAMDPRDRVLHYMLWKFEAAMSEPAAAISSRAAGPDRFTYKIMMFRSDRIGLQTPESLAQHEGLLGRTQLAKVELARRVTSAAKIPEWVAIPLWTARAAFVSSGIRGEQGTNPLVLAILGFVSVLDTAVEYITDWWGDWELDGDGTSFIKVLVRGATDALGIDPAWGDLVAAGAKFGMSLAGLAASAPFTIATAKNALKIAWDLISALDWLKSYLDVCFAVRALYPGFQPGVAQPVSRAPPPAAAPSGANRTATVLLIDVSGSMGNRSQGVRKIDGARDGAHTLCQMISTESMAEPGAHLLGVVAFASNVRTPLELTLDYTAAQQAIATLDASGNTNLGGALERAVDILSSANVPPTRIAILLSDGQPTTGMKADEILAGPVQRAQAAGIPVYTIGYGEPGDLDEDLLRSIAARTGGEYAYASTPDALRSIYARHRLIAFGEMVAEKAGTIAQGQTVDVARFAVKPDTEQLDAVLMWPGSALDLILTDPQGRIVDQAYQGAHIQPSRGMVHIVVRNPLAGVWRALAYGRHLPQGRTTYKAMFTVRVPALRVPPAPRGFPFVALGTALATAYALAVVVVLLMVRAGSRTRKLPATAALPADVVPGERITIGRSPESTVCLDDDDTVSWRHATISRNADGTYTLTDDSTNGTVVDGHPLRRASRIVRAGATVKIGSSVFRFSPPALQRLS